MLTTKQIAVTDETIKLVTEGLTINTDVSSANDGSNLVTEVASVNESRIVELMSCMVLAGIMQKGATLEEGSDGIIRFPDPQDSDGKKAGWVSMFFDEKGQLAAAQFGSWRDESEKYMWRDSGYSALPEIEQSVINTKIQAAIHRRKEEIATSQKEARMQLMDSISTLSVITEHPYFERKGIQVKSTVYGQGTKAVIPLFDVNGELVTVQRIDEDGSKRLGAGCGKSGAFHWIKGNDNAVLIAEGFATAASLFEATGYTTVMAIDCGNLKYVASAISKHPKYEYAPIVICADNDQFGEKNIGKEKAAEAAIAVSASVVLPEFTDLDTKPTDFNDLHQLEGLEAVKAQVMPVIDLALLGLPEGYELKQDGVYLTQLYRDELITSKICSPLKVISMTRDDVSGNWGLQLKLKDPDNKEHSLAISNEMLLAENEYLGALVREGLKFDPSKKKFVHSYLSNCKPISRAINTDKVGWLCDKFVLPDRLIGKSNEEIVLQSSRIDRHGFEQKGTLTEWQQNLSSLCIGNSRMIFAVSAAFAPVLLPLVGEESAGFHFRCGSSRGKTTILRLAKSVWGNPTQLPKWRATGNGIEGLAAKHNHCLLCLDELGQADPKQIGDSVYMLGNGEGKQRAGRNGEARERQSWELFFLSTGEISLEATLSKVGQKTMAGQEVRFIDLPADAGAGLGAFDTIHNFDGGSQFAIAINENSYAYHGTAAQEFISLIAEDKAVYSQMALEHINNFLGVLNLGSSDPQVYRVAKKIGLVYAAGMLASELEITLWPEDEVMSACKICFDAWLKERGGDASHEETQILETIKVLLETERNSKFKSIEVYDHKSSGSWGLVDGGFYWVTTSAFDQFLCRGLDKKKVIEVLIEAGYLESANNGRKTHGKRAGGAPSRFYKVNESILSYGYEDTEADEEAEAIPETSEAEDGYNA